MRKISVTVEVESGQMRSHTVIKEATDLAGSCDDEVEKKGCEF